MATTDKYDRQLRLWGAKGQQALGATHIVLVGTSSAGTETLKNLVLPGVGSFCVVDYDYTAHITTTVASSSSSSSTSTSSSSSTSTSIVTDHDASCNFFLPVSTVGQSRAEVASQYLQELNSDVSGSYQSLTPETTTVGRTSSAGITTTTRWTTILDQEQTTHPNSTVLVVTSDVEPPVLDVIAETCINMSFPLIVVQSYGLIGTVRLQLPGTVPLLDPKPTNAPPDLRLKTAFPGLLQMSDSIHLADLDSHQHSHVPYPILLYKAKQQYEASHGGRLPQTMAEKEDFKTTIKTMARDIDKEVNFEEAVANAYLAYTERDLILPDGIVVTGDVLMDDYDTVEQKASSDPMMMMMTTTTLGILYGALRRFMEQHQGRPPLNGSIPDMTASTDMYVQLQRVYKEQADQDVEEMTRLVHQLLDGEGKEVVTVTADQIASFCANVYNVGSMTTRSLMQEYYENIASATIGDESDLVDDWKMTLMDPYEDGPIHTPLLWYLGLRACQVFFHQYGRYPGTKGLHHPPASASTGEEKKVEDGSEWRVDIPILTKILQDDILVQYQLVDQQESLLTPEHCDMICQELTRYANAEIHNVASVVGGVAAQEAVKIITGQYVPLDNTYVYNGIVSVGGVYRM